MPHDANIIHTDVTQETHPEKNRSEHAARNESVSAASATPAKTTPELFRLVEFLARYEARQAIPTLR
jgi:hypothetical protein